MGRRQADWGDLKFAARDRETNGKRGNMGKSKVIVALRDAEQVDDLMKLACQLAMGMDAEVMALHVVEVPPGLPLDADAEILDRPGQEILAQARQTASGKFSREVSTQLVRAREPGEAIVAEARENSASLLILGYRHRNPVSEVLLGSAVRHVMRHAPCRVIVQVPPAG